MDGDRDLFAPPEHRCARHPERAAVATCDLCGGLCCEPCVTLDGDRQICATCLEAGRVELGGIPWEQRARLGAATAFWRTIVEVSLRPGRALAGASGAGTVAEALGFVAILLVPVSILGTLYMQGLLSLFSEPLQGFVDQFAAQMPPEAQEELRKALQPSLADLPVQVVQNLGITLPLTLAMLGLLGAVQHAILSLVGAARGPLAVTLKTTLYSVAVRAWEVVPGLGFVTTPWMLTACGLGFASAHHAPVWKGMAATWGIALSSCFCCGGTALAVGAGLAALGG